MKICSKCKQEKDESEFYKDKQRIDGLALKCKKCYKQYYKENKEKLKEISKKYYENNRVDILKRQKNYCKSHKNESAKKNEKYYKNNKKEIRERNKEWANKNKDKIRSYKQKRRARKKGSSGSVSNIEWKELCSRYGNICLRCGSSRKLTQDHVVPLSKGGFHTIYNLQPLCRSCNCSKHDKTIDYRPDVISLVTKLNAKT